jgi:protocatechuate 3,4-dioxygenase beta subunit
MDKKRIVLVLIVSSAVIPGCGVDTCRNERPSVLDGRVEDGEGEPVWGIKIFGYIDPADMPMPLVSPDVAGVVRASEQEPACSTRTDSSGYYSLSFGCGVRAIGLIPVRQECVFSPASRIWRQDDTLGGYDFTVYCGEGHLVDGHVWGREGPGQPYSGVTMCIENSDSSRKDYIVTDEDGYYAFYDLYPLFDYEIAPSIYCPEFEPASRTIKHPAEDYHDQDFTAVTPQFVYITGCVRDPYGAPLEGVTIEFSHILPSGGGGDVAPPPTGSASNSVETDADGRYRIPAISCQYLEVNPSETGCFAVPRRRSYGSKEDIDGEDYTLFCGEGYTISGHLRNEHGEPMPDRAVRASGYDFGLHQVRTDAGGYYELANLPWGLDYEVKPGRCSSLYTCQPAYRQYQDLDGDYSDQDFIMIRID